MNRLRFCMVTTFYPPYSFGGDAVVVQRLSRALVRRGHHVTVVHDVDAFQVLAGARAPEDPASDDGVEVVQLRSPLGHLSTLLTQQVGRPLVHGGRIRGILERGNYDVINFHNVSLVGGPGVLRYGEAAKIYMAHEHWLVCPTHTLWRHARERCTGRQCLRCSLAHRRPPQLWRHSGLLERELRHIDTFVAMSEFSREKHREFGFPREMEVLGPFLPDAHPRAADRGTAPHPRPYFLFVGRLERIKGLDDVIPVFREYAHADLLVIGDGHHAHSLRGLAADSPRVRFLGRLAPEALDSYYRAAIALIVPSVCYETFGMTMIEAMRVGTPVIARNVGPLPEIVSLADAGLVFDDAPGLLRALQRMQSDHSFRESKATAAQRGFAARWSESAVLPRYLDLARAAIVKRRDRGAIAP